MKKSKFLLSLLFASMCLLAASCLSNDNSASGIVTLTTKGNVLYANSTKDTLYVLSYSPWKIQALPGSEWCTLGTMSGKADTYYIISMALGMNTTGKARLAPFTIADTNKPESATTFEIKQMATRGDGTLGNAAQVKRIESTDGYVADISYDEKARPVSYQLTGNGVSDRLTVYYDEYQNQILVTRNGREMKGDMDTGYQSSKLIGASDTVYYQSQYYNGMPILANYTFSFISRDATQGLQAYAYLLISDSHPEGQSVAPDSLHVADSLRYVHQGKSADSQLAEMLELHYSTADNRCQSVDVNQLLLGFAECQPMQLLSLFRYTRSTSIVSEAKSDKGDIKVTTTLNADKSVSTMKVERGGSTVTYTFTY